MTSQSNIIILPKPTYPSACREMTEEEIAQYTLDSCGATVLDVLWVPIDLINIKNRTHQTRKKDSTPEKIKYYERDLQNRGLVQILLVEWDSINQCFINITGYTRTNAALNLKWTHMPVAVVDIATLVGKPLWNLKQQANAHPPATPHNMDDAVYGLQDLASSGYFANWNKEDIAKECHKELQKYYPAFERAKRTQVINRVFNWETNRTRQLGAGERERLRKEIYPTGVNKIGKTENSLIKTVAFHTDNSNAAKMLGNKIASLSAVKERVEQVDNEVWSPVKMNVVVSIAGRDSDKIPQARKEVLDRYKNINKHGISPTLGRVNEVTFPHQIEEPIPETENITYRWNIKQKTFIKTKQRKAS